MNIRKATAMDIETILSFIKATQEDFEINGINQWQNGYPNRESILQDILSGHGFVCQKGEDVVSYFYFNNEEDPYYEVISEGAWKNSDPYFVIHRFVVDPLMRGQGIAKWILKECSKMISEENITNIRVDTHPDNLGMIKLLQACNYKYCGVVRVKDGLRLAFQYVEKGVY